MKIYCMANFKFSDKGVDSDFKRLHFYTFFETLDEAVKRSSDCFCDEAGWYEGFIIEEKKSGDPSFRGIRKWFIQKSSGKIEEISEPNRYNNIINLIE